MQLEKLEFRVREPSFRIASVLRMLPTKLRTSNNRFLTLSPIVFNKLVKLFWSIARPLLVFSISIICLFLLYYSIPSILQSIEDAGFKKSDVRYFDWRAFAPILFAVASAPVWFALWYLRDRNAVEKIRIEKRDSNLEYFQSIKSQASTILKPDHENYKTNLVSQRSAINGLESFLKGEHGREFQKPALDTLIAISEIFYEESGAKK